MADAYHPVPLIRKQINGTISIPEKAWLDAWANESEENRLLMERYTNPAAIRSDVRALLNMNEKRMDRRFSKEFGDLTRPEYIQIRHQRTGKIIGWSAAIAAVVASLVFGLPQLWRHSANRLEARPVALQQLLQEMTKKVTMATLTYKGDSVRYIYIDDARPEERLAQVGNLLITKRDRRFLAIADVDPAASDNKSTDNAIFSIPAGESWQVLLPDNSKIFLKPGSSLSLIKKRTLALEGSATIDVYEDSVVPFHLLSSHLQTSVTGTRFTVSDYRDGKTAMAILHRGRLTVDNGTDSVMLQPKQQAIVSSAFDKIRLANDTSFGEELRWQTPYFDFSHERLPASIKRVIAWYDIRYYRIRSDVDTTTLGKLRSGPVGKDLTLHEFLQEVQAPDLHIWVSNDKSTLIVDKDVTK